MDACSAQSVTTGSFEEELTEYLEKFSSASGFLSICEVKKQVWAKSDSRVELLESLNSDLFDDGQKGRNCLILARKCLSDKNVSDAIGFIMKSMMLNPRTWASYNLLRIATNQCGLIDASVECSRKKIPVFLKNIFLQKPSNFIDVLNEDAEGIDIYKAFPSEETILEAPKSINVEDHAAYDHKKITSNAGYTISLENGYLWFDGFNITAWDESDRIVENASAGYPDVINELKHAEKLTVLSGTVCFLANRVASNYYHWMNDIVPRLGVLHDSGISLDSIDFFILPAIQKSFQKETLKHFNIHPERVHRFTQGKYIKANRLLMPIYGSNEHLVRVDTEQWMNLHSLQSARSAHFLKSSFIGKEQQNRGNEPGLRLYISRGSDSSRSIANEDELLNVLDRYNFKKIQLENYSVNEQAKLFNNAEIVFGPHGAGFTNIVFCQNNTKVIEIFQDYTASCFWFLSELVGHRHYVHKCEKKHVRSENTDQKFSSTQERDRLAQFHVDPDEIAALFELAEISPIKSNV